VEKPRLAGARPSAEKLYRSINKMTVLTPAGFGGEQMGGKRRGVPVKTLKKLLKKAGLKTTGKKAALTRRAKQAKLVKKGGVETEEERLEAETKRLAEEARRKGDENMEAMAKGATITEGGSKRKPRSKKYF
jgi:hypothetical protein